MALMTYQDARPWARSIKERVIRRDVLLWPLDKSEGIRRYKNDISLSDEEIATIASGWTWALLKATRPTCLRPARSPPRRSSLLENLT